MPGYCVTVFYARFDDGIRTSTSASLSGTVADVSKGVLSGAVVTARNAETGMETKITSNSSGVYNFPSLQPGTYTVTAEAPGLQRRTMTDVRLRAATQSNLNFELAVAGTVTELEVTASVESMVIEAGASTGSVVQEDMVVQLPILSGNVLELIDLMGGVVRPQVGSGGFDNPDMTASNTTFAGVNANNINITRDGVSVNEVRFQTGVNTPTRMNTEMVGEFRMVLSPVDAELGRGAGQIQMTTRSGSNQYHGSAIWNIQNTALDANEWLNKNKAENLRRVPAWRNLNNYTLTANGPIFRNKTFFSASWDHQLGMSKSYTTQTVLTPCARKGIYRYLDGALSGNAISVPSISTGYTTNVGGVASYVISATRPSVNPDGSPREQYTFPDEGRYDQVMAANVPAANRQNVYAGGLWNGPRDLSADGIIHYRGAQVNNHLMYQSVLGGLSEADRIKLGGNPGQVPNPGSPVYSNCEGYNISPGDSYLNGRFTNRWDGWRNTYDKSGFIQRYTDMMPLPNDYTGGDGLNTARIGWTRRQKGSDSSFGTGDSNRKSITGKIDHNINDNHRASGSFSYDIAHSQDQYIAEAWPENSWGGSSDRTPLTFQVSLSSTLRPTLLNEFRVGLSRTQTSTNNALGNALDGDKVREKIKELFPTDNWTTYKGLVVARPSINYGNVFGNYYTSTWGGKDQRWTVTENITWMKGAHSFKGGVEFRRNDSLQITTGSRDMGDSYNVIPTIVGGNMGTYSPLGQDYDNIAGIGPFTGYYPDAVWQGLSEYDRSDYGSGRSYTSAKLTTARNLMQFMSGQVGNVQQFFYVVDSSNPRWSESLDAKDRAFTLMNKELHLFFKDDWKLTRDLTLNLGFRWEYYGPPSEKDGMTAGVKDGIAGMYGVSRNLAKWMPDYSTLVSQSSLDYNTNGTKQMFIGPNSGHPDIPVYNKDLNNWAPHVGFAWQLPWFGKGKTTLRGGYSISYSQIANFDVFAGYVINVAGITQNYMYTGERNCIPGSDPPNVPSVNGCFVTYDNVDKVFPLDVNKTGQKPFGSPGYGFTRENYSNNGMYTYDPNIRNPYIQNVNLSVTRNLNRFLTLDVRYIGTLSRKSLGALNLSTPNYFANGLFGEFEKLRAGTGDPKSLTDFPILNSGIIPYKGDPKGSTTASLYAPMVGANVYDSFTGAEQLLYNQWTNLARGSFQTIAQTMFAADFTGNLINYNNPATGQRYRPSRPTNETAGQVLRAGGAPDNLIYANPQFPGNTAATGGAFVNRNQGRSHYHSMQTQVTMRPMHGLSFQATWTWSRSLSRGGVLDYREDSPDSWVMEKSISGQHRLHTLSTYGAYELPFGARGFLFRDASGVFKKAIEGWRLSWIGQLSTGAPMSLGGYSTVWYTSRSQQVGPFDPKDVGIKWYNPEGSRPYATYFNKEYMWVPDPQCSDRVFVRAGTALVYPIPGQTSTSLQPMETLCGQIGGGRNALAEVAGYQEIQNPNGTTTMKKVPGQVIFQNSVPGVIGNKGGGFITSPGSWSLDATMAKSVEFMEGKQLEVRVDAQNVFNHAGPNFVADPAGTYPTYWNARTVGAANPNVTMTDPNNDRFFGEVNSKAGHRTFQAKLSLRF